MDSMVPWLSKPVDGFNFDGHGHLYFASKYESSQCLHRFDFIQTNAFISF
jgi:hypothetical protein